MKLRILQEKTNLLILINQDLSSSGKYQKSTIRNYSNQSQTGSDWPELIGG